MFSWHYGQQWQPTVTVAHSVRKSRLERDFGLSQRYCCGGRHLTLKMKALQAFETSALSHLVTRLSLLAIYGQLSQFWMSHLNMPKPQSFITPWQSGRREVVMLVWMTSGDRVPAEHARLQWDSIARSVFPRLIIDFQYHLWTLLYQCRVWNVPVSKTYWHTRRRICCHCEVMLILVTSVNHN